VTETSGPSDRPPDAGEPQGLAGLLEGLRAALAQLFRHQIALAGSEAQQSLGRLKTGLVLLALALVLALVTLNAAASAAIAALVAAGLGPVLSPALVALAGLGLVVLCLWAALQRLSARSLLPHRTMAALRRNGETLVNMVKSDA
jgi:phosphatidylglycerophosphate synthase